MSNLKRQPFFASQYAGSAIWKNPPTSHPKHMHRAMFCVSVLPKKNTPQNSPPIMQTFRIIGVIDGTPKESSTLRTAVKTAAIQIKNRYGISTAVYFAPRK